MDYCADNPHRLHLSESAAAGADVLPQLRLLMLAEALSAPSARHALDLNAETAALCTAAGDAVRRRPGWLYTAFSPAPLPVLLPRSVWQAAVLCLLRGVQPSGRAVVMLQAGTDAAVAVFHADQAANMPGDTLPLLRRTAALTGGVCVVSAPSCPSCFAAALRLPLAHSTPLREPPAVNELLYSRYNPLLTLLDGFTV